MENYNCVKCGGALAPEGDERITICPWCGSIVSIPKVNTAKFNEANRLRMTQQFDLAAAAFQDILADNPKDSESYWNLLLCRYGIEYVDDVDGSKVPTCHRMSYDSIQEDEDYKRALQYADGSSRRLYEQQAAEIDRKLREIAQVARTQKDYDVFISYKETDSLDSRTEDSVMAQGLYDKLTERGYRVFFSRVTLKEWAGRDYEPIIFAALHSAKAMIVVGTSLENYEAPWVKNEWSRYREIMNREGGRHLVIVYKKGMDPNRDFPKEFAMHRLQAIEATLGFEQDVATGLEKVIGRREEKKQGVFFDFSQEDSVSETKLRLANFLRRGRQELERQNMEAADGYFQKALDLDAKCAQAWWGKFLASTKSLTKMASSGKGPLTPEEQRLLNYAMEYASANEKKVFQDALEDYLDRYDKKEQEKRAERFEGLFSELQKDTHDAKLFPTEDLRKDKRTAALRRLADAEQMERLEAFLRKYDFNYEKYQEYLRKMEGDYLDQKLYGDPATRSICEERDARKKKFEGSTDRVKKGGLGLLLIPGAGLVCLTLIMAGIWKEGSGMYLFTSALFLLSMLAPASSLILCFGKGVSYEKYEEADSYGWNCLALSLIPGIPLALALLYSLYRSAAPYQQDLTAKCVFMGAKWYLLAALIVLGIIFLFAEFKVGVGLLVGSFLGNSFLDELFGLMPIYADTLERVMKPYLILCIVLLAAGAVLCLWASRRVKAQYYKYDAQVLMMRNAEQAYQMERNKLLEAEKQYYREYIDASYLEDKKKEKEEKTEEKQEEKK